MTSASSSERRQRNLAVYQVPPPPGGWEGRDLVRIVDALGIGAAWLDTRRLGSVVALYLRADAGDAWTRFESDEGEPIVVVGDCEDRSSMWQRDPIAASFSSADGALLSHVYFDDGALGIETTVGISLHASLAAPIEIGDASTDNATCLRLSLRNRGSALEGGSEPVALR